MSRGRLIIVNGGSSVGKTSLCRALQDMLEEMHLLLGIDAFWSALPPKELDLAHVEEKYYRTESTFEDGKEYFRIVPGPLLDQAMYGRYRALRGYLDMGIPVIADEVLWKREWLLDALQVLEGYEVHFVGATISDEEGARRERIRGDRHTGWDRGSQRYAHRDAIYDFHLDTSDDPTPQTSAARLKAYLDEGRAPTAFARLREKFAGELADWKAPRLSGAG